MIKNNRLRIVSGIYGGQYIEAPKTGATHPMGERERMAIFNRLRDEIPGRRVLDAFAGSGAIGIEAISLGASRVDFMENNGKAIKAIKQNLAKLQCLDKTAILRWPDGDYGIIFADPPYDNPQYEYIEEILKSLKHGGIFVLSHPETPAPWEFRGLSLFSDKSYAAAHIKMYQNP